MKSFRLAASILCFSVLFAACNPKPGQLSLTKDDSSKIATAYYKNYPAESKAYIEYDQGQEENAFLPNSEFTRLKDNYLKMPSIVNKRETPLQGFTFAGPQFMRFIRLDGINGIYAAFIKKADGKFSIALQALDGKGGIIRIPANAVNVRMLQDSSTADFEDFYSAIDKAPPCPDACP